MRTNPRRDRTGLAVVIASTSFDRPEANHHFDRTRGRPPPPRPPWIEAGDVYSRC